MFGGVHAMTENPNPPKESIKKQTRQQALCIYCRNKRIKCEPTDREWNENRHQKCDKCNKDGSPCSRSYRRKSDPSILARQKQQMSIEQILVNGGEVNSNSVDKFEGLPYPDSENKHKAEHDGDGLLGTTESVSRRRMNVSGSCHGQVGTRERVMHTLAEYESLLEIMEIEDVGRPFPCPRGRMNDSVFLHAAREDIHRLFKEACDTALEVEHEGNADLAGTILSRLVFASSTVPRFFDKRKLPSVTSIWQLARRLQYRKIEHFLWSKLAYIWEEFNVEPNDDLCKDFAESLNEASQTSQKVFEKLWNTRNCDLDTPKGISISANLRASRLCAPSSFDRVSTLLPSGSDSPGMFELQPIHIAAASGNKSLLEKIINTHKKDVETQRNETIDARDRYGQTALFIAAGNGHHDCCEYLLSNGAYSKTRDEHGHVILEAAVKSGDFHTVQLLEEHHATVEPQLTCNECASSPLQAAFEAKCVNEKIVRFLVKHEADGMWTRFDGKNAIKLAEEKREWDLHELMLEKLEKASYDFASDYFLGGPAVRGGFCGDMDETVGESLPNTSLTYPPDETFPG